jgi:hypothetical protein
MASQGMTEVAIASKLGVDNTTISKDIKALKLISQQFIYDIAKSDFTFYYKQSLDLVKLILQKQFDIVNKEDDITQSDMNRAKILTDILGTVSTINGYYDSAPDKHMSSISKIHHDERFGVRPGTRTRTITMTEEEEMAEMKEWEEEDRKEREQEALLDAESEVRMEQEMKHLEKLKADHKQLY